jgi:pilus assembly protein CpaE
MLQAKRMALQGIQAMLAKAADSPNRGDPPDPRGIAAMGIFSLKLPGSSKDMTNLVHILISGPSEPDLLVLKSLLSELPGVEVRTRLLGKDSPDPLAGVAAEPDLLIHHLGDPAERELAALAARPARARPTTLLIALRSEVNARIMRLAMQAGARDFILGATAVEDTLAITRKIVKEKLSEKVGPERRLTAIFNAKGGAGASTIAGNLAHMLAAKQELRTVLLDLDLQFGSQSLNFDLHPQQGLAEALDAVDVLDEIALTGYMARHASGLHVLGTLPSQLLLPGEMSEKRLGQLLDLSMHAYEQVVADLPRLIDPVLHLVLERATQVLIVLQQNLANLRDGQRLVRILTDELGIPRDRLRVVINRYDARNSIGIENVIKALQHDSITTIPNDFKHFSAAANLGVPMAEYAPNIPATRALLKLATVIGPNTGSEKKGFFHQFISRLSSGA